MLTTRVLLLAAATLLAVSNAAQLRPAARQTTCSSSAPCAGTDEYCASSGFCEAIPYSQIVPTSSPAFPTDAFSLVMATDVQFYFINCKDEPYTECIYDKRPSPSPSDSEKEQFLREATDRQVDCIDHLVTDGVVSNVKAIFNGGDITNSGYDTQLAEFESRFHNPIAALGLPMVVVLGNHDYNSGTADESKKRMINFLEAKMVELANKHPIRSIDFETTPVVYNEERGKNVKYTKGSLCFSIEINQYVFIIMHWAAAINGGILEYDFEWPDSAGYTEIFEITSAVSWFKAELNNAQSEGKKVYLVPHSFRGLSKFVDKGRLRNKIRKSTVEAVITGHDHDQWGYFGEWTVGASRTRDIPVYYAGSVSYQKLITLDFLSNGNGLSAVTPYDSKTGSSCAATSDDSAT